MRKFCTALAVFAFSWAFAADATFADTIETATFTDNVGATIAGSIVFDLPSSGVADLSNVISFSATSTSIDYSFSGPVPQTVVVPAATYTLANLTYFSYGPVLGCYEVGNPMYANVSCEMLQATFTGPQQQFANMIVDSDPALGVLDGEATFEPIPDEEGIHGGVTAFTLTASAMVPEPSTWFYTMAVAVCLLLMGTWQARDGDNELNPDETISRPGRPNLAVRLRAPGTEAASQKTEADSGHCC